MHLRRTSTAIEPGGARLDRGDVFLLMVLEEGMSLSQLVDLAEQPANSVLARVMRLIDLGLLAVSYASADERLLATQLSREVRVARESTYAVSSRPPLRQIVAPEDRGTLPPAQGYGEDAPVTGVRLRPPAVPREFVMQEGPRVAPPPLPMRRQKA